MEDVLTCDVRDLFAVDAPAQNHTADLHRAFVGGKCGLQWLWDRVAFDGEARPSGAAVAGGPEPQGPPPPDGPANEYAAWFHQQEALLAMARHRQRQIQDLPLSRSAAQQNRHPVRDDLENTRRAQALDRLVDLPIADAGRLFAFMHDQTGRRVVRPDQVLEEQQGRRSVIDRFTRGEFIDLTVD